MQKSDTTKTAKATRRQVKASTTLNRKYVKKPTKPVKRATTRTSSSVTKNSANMVKVKRAGKIQHFSRGGVNNVAVTMNMANESEMVAPQAHPIHTAATSKMRARAEKMSGTNVVPAKLSAKELKDREIKKAMSSASKATGAKSAKKRRGTKLHFGFGRVVLALSCAAAAVFAIVYFVNLNMPDISLRVAAMQTGIEASYPNYVPRDYSLSDIVSENGKITLNFKNSTTNETFSLIEEQSSWDSNALLTNFVRDTYGENYTIIREQGLTLYVSGSNAAWVNGGVMYKINVTSGSLTKKQIKAIAVSL